MKRWSEFMLTMAIIVVIVAWTEQLPPRDRLGPYILHISQPRWHDWDSRHPIYYRVISIQAPNTEIWVPPSRDSPATPAPDMPPGKAHRAKGRVFCFV